MPAFTNSYHHTHTFTTTFSQPSRNHITLLLSPYNYHHLSIHATPASLFNTPVIKPSEVQQVSHSQSMSRTAVSRMGNE
ncbi:hypothetical protein E2C01_088907 [Portunus trituberculatus]|uniref:Uncharacterized protein n=1 Tax=Portunus trituberculatus TaxID=210409 RepID=A0A5B7JHQ3_PORTR|nr:hypothetical protein [Portunus trituberculatus]